ncbi:hypothetical protein FACS1894204_13130 [Synergistales bacterium]|nr:hypothetical protein FACS1894204_13130 [Synergistales bacterium]
MLEREYKPEQIMEALDVSRSFVYATKKAYNERGIEGIKPGKRGRRAGAKRTLTPEQEKEIQRVIIDKNPEQMKIKCCLWTRKVVQELILCMYKINMPLVSVGWRRNQCLTQRKN